MGFGSLDSSCASLPPVGNNNNNNNMLGKAMVESVACYGCLVWLLKREKQRKLLDLGIDIYGGQLECPDYKNSQTPPLGAKCK